LLGIYNILEMAKEILFEADYCTVIYDDAHFIYIKVTGYFSSKIIQEYTMEILGLAHLKECTNIIIDQTEMRGTWSYALKWLEDEFLPIIREWKDEIRIAYISPNDTSSKQSLYRFIEIINDFDIQVFEDLEESKSWLLDLPQLAVLDHTLKVISVLNKGRHMIIEVDTINYLWISKKIVYLATKDKTYETRSTLKNILQKLPDYFLQIHRNYAINLKKVASIKYYAGGSYLLYIKNLPKTRIPVGRVYAAHLKKRLGIVSR
jgi:hypothetical protein